MDHFRLLLYKEFIVIWRSKVWSLIELATPLLLSVPLIILILQNSSEVKHEAEFWDSFRVTGDWRDVDRRIGKIKSIYNYCGMTTWRNLGLVFPTGMDVDESLRIAREIESRYEMRVSSMHAHSFTLNVTIFKTESAMMKALLNDYHRSLQCTQYIAGVVFNEFNRSISRLSYTLRVRQTEDPQTHWYVGNEIWESGGPYEVLSDQFPVNLIPNYWSMGILSLQYAIDVVFLKIIDEEKYNDAEFEFSLERMPEPAYFEKAVVGFFTFLIIFWQLFSLPSVLHTAFLNVMGMQSSTFYAAHATISFVKLMIVLLTTTIMLLPLIQTVSPFLLICTNVIYGASAVAFSLLMSSIFHTSGAATKATVVIWLAFIALTKFRATEESIFLNTLLSLNLNYAYTLALHAIQDYMNRDQSLTFYNMFENANYMYPFGAALIMMIFNVVWMSLLAIYLDHVYPYGDLPRKHWFFFMNRSSNEDLQFACDDELDAPNSNIQVHEGSDQADIDIRRLTKTYKIQPAVNRMSFRAYRGEITVLLGHNGAGKSTTFSMITGIIKPTSGSIYICGNKMDSRSLVDCQQEIGFCPQYNALFSLLTVREHLEIFCKLSGNTVNCVDDMLADIQMGNAADVIAEKLSGGMKRKLCVGISLIGGRRIVLLDEPTAGMDPSSRLAILRLLQRCKKERTMLLTTHCMDEADSLGDRIAIMVEGRLVCAGSPGFLKSRFGTGYLMSIDLMPHTVASSFANQKENIMSAIRAYVPEARLQSATPQQITVLLPANSKNSFCDLFARLEKVAQRYGINSFGLSLNTLEQVFLKVGELKEMVSTNAIEMENITEDQASVLCSHSFTQTGFMLWLQQISALVNKRFICYRRQWPRLIWQIFLPTVLLLFVILYMRQSPAREDKRNEIVLNAGRISPSIVLIKSEEPRLPFVQNLLQIIENMKDHSYKFVPPKENLMQYLAVIPKIPPPVSVAVSSRLTSNRIIVNAFFNAKARYGPVIATTLVNNARLGYHADSIQISLHSYGNVSSVNPFLSLNSQMFLIAPVLIISFAFVSCGFVTYIVDDFSTNFLHQQLRARLSAFTYWMSVVVSDLLLYTFICIIFSIILGVWMNNLKPDLVFLWLIYLWPSMPFVYIMAFLIKNPARAYVVLIILTLVVALCASIISYVVMSMKPKFYPYLHTGLLFTLPTYAMSFSLIQILVANVNGDAHDMYSWENLGRVYAIMTCSGLLFWIILSMINSRVLRVYMHGLCSVVRKTSSNTLLDIDVKNEKERVLTKKKTELSLAVHNLNKYYGNVHAVRDLTFGINHGECFGLLGVNGAGKTTTFDMLTGMSIPDSGEAFINGRSILKKQTIGFCPQFDALHPKLTARETLRLLSSLHGFLNSEKRVKTTLEAVSLITNADVCTECLSGGQRRRLNLAIALIARTDLILLDEPTAGVDPKARRQIWCLLNAVRENRRSILLTSHSMTECEALCSRIGIMDQGSLIAIGTPQHIKTRFGEKYTLSITVLNKCELDDLIHAVEKIFPGSSLSSIDVTCLTWDIPKQEFKKWSEMYAKMNQLAKQFPSIVDYSLTQATLEKAFLHLSRCEK
ncbi:unnamed protein product [Thelazia callipaeda]|uniref:ABC transporter domain-containing protein n=1 Tax=Thelazia callipaeda TaxID=103827 RepID=A0A0N5CXE8_THECL|nr:unnamed protein product [Thelazia callipaeda]